MEHPDSELLVSFADGVLDDAQTTDIRAHIEQCPICREIVASERQFSEALRAQPLIQPSPSFDRTVLDTMLPASARSRREEASIRKYAGLIVLCVVTLIVVAISSGQGGDSPGWMRPVSDAMSSANRTLTDGFVVGIKQLFSPLHAARSSSGVFDIFALAVLALLVLGGIDRVIAPLVRKGR